MASYVTKEGLGKMKAELEQLETVERPKITQQIAEARDKGDLSENAEYDAAKEAQGMLEMRISKLKDAVATSKIIDESQLDTSKVSILTTVKLKNNATKQEQVFKMPGLIISVIFEGEECVVSILQTNNSSLLHLWEEPLDDAMPSSFNKHFGENISH